MEPSENGASSPGILMQTTCDEDLRGLATSGTWMKYSSRSMDAFITHGVQLIRMVTLWTSWSKAKETRKLPRGFFRKLLKGLRYVPRVIITDRLRSYSAAKGEVLLSLEHCDDNGLNNRAENSQSAYEIARACDETVQVIRTRATFSFSLRTHYVTLPRW